MSDVRRLQSKLKRGERKTRSAQAPREKTEIGEPKWNTDRTRQPLKPSRGAGRATFESPLSRDAETADGDADNSQTSVIAHTLDPTDAAMYVSRPP